MDSHALRFITELSPEKIGIASMKKNVTSKRLIGDLAKSGLRPPHPLGAPGIAARVTTALAMDATVSASRDSVAALARVGEDAQSLRDGRALDQVAEAIRAVALDKAAESIGNYFAGLSLCRLGAPGYPEAKRILLGVARNGPELFRAKALVTLGTLLIKEGDAKTGALVHDEACRIAVGCGRLALPLFFHVASTRYHLKSIDGDHRAAIEGLRRLAPSAKIVGVEQPPLLYIFKNNLAIELAETGALEEAASLAEELRTSPFARLYPEWLRTSDEIAWKTRKPSGNMVFIGEPFTGAVDESQAIGTAESREHTSTVDADWVEPGSALTATCSSEPTPLQATVAAALLEFRCIISQSTFPSTTNRGIRAPWPARLEHRPPGQGYAQSPPARAPPLPVQ
jgi:hypothetical protein